MHRLIVLILAAVDAVIAAAVGLAIALAPMTLIWVFAAGGADWSVLWPASASVWQLGHFVPLDIALGGDYLAETGIDASAASFALSLAPLAFATFTAIFAARSGRRASQADAWALGVITGATLFTAIAVGVAVTSHLEIVQTDLWAAILFPALVYTIPAIIGAIATEWSDASEGRIAQLRDRIEAARDGWGEVIGLTARGTAVVIVGLIGFGALATAVALLARGGNVVALFETAHVDAMGATVLTMGQLAYLPTLVIWAVSYIAGPGFVLGGGTTIAPTGTQVGVLPGIPALGAIPPTLSPWLLLLALLPVALGAFAGWIARSRLAPEQTRDDAAPGAGRTAVLTGVITPGPLPDADVATTSEPVGVRLTVALGIAVLSAACAAVLCALASGSIGPGSLAMVGPPPGPVALAVGLEVALGAGILLLSPRRTPGRGEDDADDRTQSSRPEPAESPTERDAALDAPSVD